MSRLSIWLAAARPRTVPAAIVPVAVGTAVAHATRTIACLCLAALAGALAIQIGTNFANDVFDAERGADGPDRIGPVRAVSAGLISAVAMKRAMIAAFAIASLFGLYLTATAGWPIVAIGITSILAGIAYTGGPWPLGYHGLGDVFVLAFFGLVAVCGTAYVQLGSVAALALWASLPVGALATAILVVNNVRDRATDARAGKRTLAVRLGRRGAIIEYAAVIAYAVPLNAVCSPWRATGHHCTVCLAILRNSSPPSGPSSTALVATAQLMLAHGTLFGSAWCWMKIIAVDHRAVDGPFRREAPA
jgi:1,4-dihydroxy-2-naphthoate octaprenyltransferase